MTNLRTLVGVCILFAFIGAVVAVPLALGRALVQVAVSTVAP